MKSQKIIFILIFSIMSLSLYRCKTEEIILHGEISGLITDTSTNQPLQAVTVKLNPLDDTTSTGIDGKYLFKSLIPGTYEVLATKQAYAGETRNATVNSANTTIIHFALQSIPVIHYSKTDLDYGIDLESLSFTISKSGIGKVAYTISPNNDWINVYPLSGDVDNETDTITVTVNRSGLTQDIIKEWIKINTSFLQYESRDTVGIYLNGVLDIDKNYYKVVEIGNQIWMAEDLKTTKYNDGTDITNITDKTAWVADKTGAYCWYDNSVSYKATYGALYNWFVVEAAIGGKNMCPTGWHVPTDDEWRTLITYLGSENVAGGKLKETGTVHWYYPNEGATNETGFTALPGGNRDPGGFFLYMGNNVWYWSSTEYSTTRARGWSLSYSQSDMGSSVYDKPFGFSVRCLRDN